MRPDCQVCGKPVETFDAPIVHEFDGDTVFCHPWCEAKYEFDKASWMAEHAEAAKAKPGDLQ